VHKFFKILVTATLLTNVAPASSAPESSSVVTSPSATAVYADPALWVVKDKDTTIYLFGTIHVLKPNIIWFDGGVKKAYDASAEVIFEIIEPDGAIAQKMVLDRAIDKDGPPLSKKLPPETATAYTKVLESLGIPATAFETIEPWFVTNTLTVLSMQKLGYNPENGVDKQLAIAAKRDGKALGELESITFQLDLFDTMPEAQQITLLAETVKELPEGDKTIKAMVDNWAKGQPDILASQMNAEMASMPELKKLLLTDRNIQWARWIEKRMEKPGTLFIAVGAGHLAGPESVQALLKARHIKAKRIKS
jgi:uncharacterized protein